MDPDGFFYAPLIVTLNDFQVECQARPFLSTKRRA
jgi:hypothetical protein